MKTKYLTVAAALGLLAGCAHEPMPAEESTSVSYPQRISAAYHWSVLAENVARQCQTRLSAETGLSGAGLMSQPIYISPPRMETAFGRAFYDLLTTRLVEKGFIVTSNPDAVSTSCTSVAGSCKPLLLKYNLEVVDHLSPSAWYYDGATRTEVVLTSSLSDAERVLFSDSGVYYIDDMDKGLYEKYSRTLKVVDQ